MAGKEIIHVLVAEASFNEADRMVSALKDAGFAIREQRVEDREDLEAALAAQSFHLVICAEELEALTTRQAIEATHAVDPTTPVLIVANEANEPKITAALEAGACDLVERDAERHFQLAAARELRHVKARRELERYTSAYRESERRCHTLLDSSRDAIAYVHDGMHIYANTAYLERFGYADRDELEGMPIMDLIAADGRAQMKELLRGLARGDMPTEQVELEGLKSDGGAFRTIVEFSPASIDGEPCTQVVFRDPPHDEGLEDKIKYLSTQDPLTGLSNRQYFLKELELTLDNLRSSEGAASMLLVEVDGFKQLVDRVGIGAADQVLAQLAAVLRDNVAEAHVVARFGDNTFALLLNDAEEPETAGLAESLRQNIADHVFEANGRSATVTVSIGACLIDEHTESAQEAVGHADLARGMAGKDGGNKVRMHNPIADRSAEEQRDEVWLAEISRALKENRFRLVFQPIVSLHGDKGENYEVLVRMIDKQNNEIMPGMFIKAAISSGLIKQIDRWVIANAIKVIAEQRRGGHKTRFYIKLSGSSLTDDTSVGWVRECLQRSQVNGDAVTIEVDESDADSHIKAARPVMQQLKELGCVLALQHFGRSPNSFNLLKHLPVDVLKLDGGFIHHLASNQQNQAVVRSITEAAKSMNLTTVAEFVEDANSLAVLWQSGVDYIQGYFLQAPDQMLAFDFASESA